MALHPAEAGAPQLPRFFAAKEVLITGATGFMGKVLIERLLSTCGQIQRLHLLMRDKRGLSADMRLAELKKSPVFENIRASCPHQLNKLVMVSGDITKPRLGLDDDSIAKLKQVSVVFHIAAIIKLSEPLRDAISNNVLSAINVMDLCDELPVLQALVHVSTAFAHSELSHVEERVYEMPVKLSHLLTLLNASSPDTLEGLTLKLIHPKANTYVFSKALAEVTIAERQQRRYPVAIFRPSIVVSSHRAPFPGWIEGLSGVTGIVVAVGQGVMRVFNFKGDCKADMVPVDIAIDNMMAVAWETATDRPVQPHVYYCGSHEHPLLTGDLYNEINRNVLRHPMNDVLYYPFFIGFNNRFVCKVFELLLQTVPLYVAEFVSKVFGKKQQINFITVAKRLSAISRVLHHFSCYDFTFSPDNIRSLRERLHNTDGHLFHFDIRDVDWQEHMLNFHRGARKYILRQDDETLPCAKKQIKRLRRIHYAIMWSLALVTCTLCVFILPKLLA